MNVVMVWAWMLWSSDALEHELYYGLGMAAEQNFSVMVEALRRTRGAVAGCKIHC